MKDAISYIRVSSEEHAGCGLGLEAQRQRIAAQVGSVRAATVVANEWSLAGLNTDRSLEASAPGVK